MISFACSEDEQSLLDTLGRFAQNQLMPEARAADRRQSVEAAVRGAYREMGAHLLGLPEAAGGIGFGLTAKILAEEILARSDAAQAVGLDDLGLAAQAVVALGSDAQIAQFLGDAERVWALASSENDPAAHLGYMSTVARRQGDGYVLSGVKTGVFNADRADWLVVLARAEEGEGLAGIAAFVVDARAPGVQIALEDRMGLRAGRPCRVQIEGASGERLAGAADPVAALTRLFDIGRAVNAARMVGAARGAMGFAVDYAQDRKAFGKPICAHQGLAFFIADMEVALESARNLVLKAAWQLESGEVATVAACNAAICAAEASVKVTVDAVQVFGGAGFMKDMPVERYMRDVRTLANALGTPEDHVAVLGEVLHGPESLKSAAKDGKKVAQA